MSTIILRLRVERLYHLLSNPVYIGKTRHGGKLYDGQHKAIIDQKTVVYLIICRMFILLFVVLFAFERPFAAIMNVAHFSGRQV
jgi:hypothetical protein